MISVAMCTYNGARYLNEQLTSIVNQETPIHELVICDDRSKDNTIQLLEDFAKTAPFPVRIHSNETNLGSTKNFEKCLLLCQGDIIFLTDQDDVWHPNKVTTQLNYFEQHPTIDAVFSNAYTIDDDSKRKPETIWEHISFDKAHQEILKSAEGYELLFDHFIVTGATLAIRKRCLARLTPFPTHLDKYIHDAWIALVLGLEGKLGFIEEPLISYRLHSSQQVGFGSPEKPVTFKDRLNRDRSLKLKPIQDKATVYKNMYAALLNNKGIEANKLAKLQDRTIHFETRGNLSSNRLARITPIAKEFFAGRYQYSSKHWWLPLIGDLFE